MKVALCGYDFFFECFKCIVDFGWEIEGIFSCPCNNISNFNVRVRALATTLDIEYTESRITEQNIESLLQRGCDLLVVAGYPFTIPIGRHSRLRGFNIHPSLLPEGRGP